MDDLMIQCLYGREDYVNILLPHWELLQLILKVLEAQQEDSTINAHHGL